MGCKICNREDSETLTQLTNKGGDQQYALPHHSEVVPTVDFRQSRDQREKLKEYTRRSMTVRVKLALDPGKVRHAQPSPVAEDRKLESRRDYGGENKARPEERFLSPTGNPYIDLPPIYLIDRSSPKDGKGNANPKDEPQLIKKRSLFVPPVQPHEQYRRLNSSFFALAGQNPLVSLPSLGFDHSCLVVENKGSLMETYKVIDLVGRGAFGVVKKVMHKATSRIYAMKVINRNCYVEADNIANEIEVLKKLVLHLSQNR